MDIVTEIDNHIRKSLWFDFQIYRYDGYKLIVAGCSGWNTYYHNLEIIFEDVFFVSAFFNGWRSDTSSTVFAVESNMEMEIEQGYTLFMFKTEDYKRDVMIAAKNISFNTDTVYYYHREDLKENERIADFIPPKP